MSENSEGPARKGRINVRDFALSYDSIDGPVTAVTKTEIHVKPGEFGLT